MSSPEINKEKYAHSETLSRIAGNMFAEVSAKYPGTVGFQGIGIALLSTELNYTVEDISSLEISLYSDEEEMDRLVTIAQKAHTSSNVINDFTGEPIPIDIGEIHRIASADFERAKILMPLGQEKLKKLISLYPAVQTIKELAGPQVFKVEQFIGDISESALVHHFSKQPELTQTTLQPKQNDILSVLLSSGLLPIDDQ